jgi:hypothetical protein
MSSIMYLADVSSSYDHRVWIGHFGFISNDTCVWFSNSTFSDYSTEFEVIATHSLSNTFQLSCLSLAINPISHKNAIYVCHTITPLKRFGASNGLAPRSYDVFSYACVSIVIFFHRGDA